MGKIKEAKSWFSENFNKADKLLARMTQKTKNVINYEY